MNDYLYFRRQFLIAREIIGELNNWQHLNIDNVHLYVHPDLEVTKKETSTFTIIMLGYIFDPMHPHKSNSNIITDLCSKVNTFRELIIALKPYTGRYAIIYRDKNCFNIVHDPLAIREIYFCNKCNNVICGSQPNIMLRFSRPVLHKSSDQLLLDFIQNHLPYVRSGRLWVGDSTPFEGIKHLLPNHYLDLIKMENFRYWPNKQIDRLDLNEAVSRSAAFLIGALKAASYRHPLMMAVTAGLDSRGLLAASKDISKSIYYFINKEFQLSENSADIKIPQKMFRMVGLPFHVEEVHKDVPADYKRIFLNNTLYAKEKSLPVIHNVYYKRHNNKMNILGVGEVGRTKFFDAPKKITPYYLAYMLKYRKSPFAVRECNKWLTNAIPIAKKFGLNIMTIFWWEVLIGNWGAVGNSESDIAIEEFDPYNSHLLYELFLSVDAKYRTFRDNILFEELIRFMWPELLSMPFNPPENIWDRITLGFHKLHLEMPLRMLKYHFYSLFYNLFWKKIKISD